MDTFLYWVDTFCFIYTGITLAGLAVYKFEMLPAESWEDAIKKMFPAFFRWLAGALPKALPFLGEWFYEEATGKTLPGNTENELLVLDNQELLEIKDRLSKHPYDTPSIEGFKREHSVLFVDISALGVVPPYKDLSNHEIAVMVEKIIQDYYLETRGVKAPAWILKASKKKLEFAVPLSPKGRKYLEELYKDILPEKQPDSKTAMEEEIQKEKTP